jgi:hypothetical protein
MFFDKCKRALLCLLAAGLLGTAGIGSRSSFAQSPPVLGTAVAAAPLPEKKELTPAEERASPRIRELLANRQQAATVEYTSLEEQFVAGRGGELERLFASAQRLLRADLEVSASKGRRIAVREEQVARMKKILDINTARFNAGRASIADRSGSNFYYLDALIELEREKAR